MGLALLLAACSSTSPPSSPGGVYKIGQPYQINGRWYYPKYEPDYDRVGTASWYGDAFHGLQTANGEVFDKNRISAAHPTLPMPSLVRVTNLDNGRSMVLRVNDRGPFVDDRLIDLSEAAARELGYQRDGLARVRVQFVGIADDARGVPPAPPRRAPPIEAPVVVADAPPRAPARTPIVLAELEPPVAPAVARQVARTPPRTYGARRGELPATALQGAAAAWPETPVARTPAVPVPAATACAPPPGPMFVQVGAFAEASSARTVAAQMAAVERVRIEPAFVNGTAVARVRLGPVTGSEARSLLGRVKDLGYDRAFLAPAGGGPVVNC
jgi:rare lipoprotein A